MTEPLLYMHETLTSAQLRAARGLVDWTTRHLVERTGVHRNTISAIEGDKSAPNSATVQAPACASNPPASSSSKRTAGSGREAKEEREAASGGGAEFHGSGMLTHDGQYRGECHASLGDRSESSNYKLFPTKEDAEAWIDAEARRRGIAKWTTANGA
jgi:transcriptional regulator with XRE-family HTH domain